MNDAMTTPAAAVPSATDWRSWVRYLGGAALGAVRLRLAAGLGALAVLYANARIALRGFATRSIRDAADWAQSDPKVLAGRVAMWASL